MKTFKEHKEKIKKGETIYWLVYYIGMSLVQILIEIRDKKS